MTQIANVESEQASISEKAKLYVYTHGCQMNEYDSRKLAKLLEAGYAQVDSAEEADLVLVNTCSVREKPEQKLYSLLGRLKELKQQNPKLMVGVGGCVAQQEGEHITKRSSVVDFVFGTHNLSLVPALIERRKQGFAPQVAVDYRDEWEDLPLGFLESDQRVSVFIAISRGCNKNCTYCIVPVTRGREVSRTPEEIEREIRMAVHRGAREVVLLGQTVNSYGLDCNPRSSFVQLLERLSEIENLWRIRFTSPHPQEVRQDFIDHVIMNQKVCRHIHMPLQSGSDRILKAMNRNYRRTKYLKIIEALKTRVPDIAITTDIIVGFPGETEEDFQASLDIMDIVQYENSFSFVYSARPGTVAAELPDALPYSEKLARLQVLQSKQDQISRHKLDAWVGKKAEVLLEGPSAVDPDCLQGRISQHFTLNLEAPEPVLRPGMLIKAEVTHASKFALRGKFEHILTQ